MPHTLGFARCLPYGQHDRGRGGKEDKRCCLETEAGGEESPPVAMGYPPYGNAIRRDGSRSTDKDTAERSRSEDVEEEQGLRIDFRIEVGA